MSKTVEQPFERHPELASVIRRFANNVPVPGSLWNELLNQINNALTTPSPDVAGSDAMAFTEWAFEKGYYQGEKGIYWHRSDLEKRWDEKKKFTAADLYAKFRKEHPQPAGASVEQAAVNYVTEAHSKQSGDKWYEEDEAEKKAFLAGAAFQAAQGLRENIENALYGTGRFNTDECDQLTDVILSALPAVKPAPAAVSAGTWVKVRERLPKTNGGVYLRNAPELFASVDLDRDGKSVALCVYNQEDEEMVYTNSHPDITTCNWEWLDESAPGIPDVRELVEARPESIGVGVEMVFVPCQEDDPDQIGTFTSNDGQWLAHVKEGRSHNVTYLETPALKKVLEASQKLSEYISKKIHFGRGMSQHKSLHEKLKTALAGIKRK